MTAMYISLANSRTTGFKRWSDAHTQRPANDDYSPGGATPIALVQPRVGGTLEEPLSQVGAAF
jgi:hypothetical protein